MPIALSGWLRAGYTALAMALALPDGGKLYACDITDEYPSIGACPPTPCSPEPSYHMCHAARLRVVSNPGKPFWEAAGVREKIDLRIGPAVDTLDELLKVGTPMPPQHGLHANVSPHLQHVS